ncbi:MAG: hypothetical protein A3I76_02650 [Elusimicrobia bacterium RIFCSPLOWO2_02_FULL_61_11]|nr:MAG: hypothetical protein A3I76_02650 [Elusimicrobia bacterium RIFCSPLOWO2_02_FULL_61_11]
MKISAALLLMALFCGSAPAQERAADPEAWKARTFAAAELKKYDGKNGMPAYAAVDGIVYDLSKSRSWKDGKHMALHNAGSDLSAELRNKAPKALHKDGKIMEKMPKVGVLEGYAGGKTAENPPPAQAEPAAPQPQAKAPLAALHKISKEELGLETSCPVTGEKVKVSEKTPALDFKGKTYYFSGLSSLDKFRKDPVKQLKKRVSGLFKKKKK